VTVDDDDPIEAVVGEAGDCFADVRAEGVGANPQRPIESAVFGGDADRDRWRDRHILAGLLAVGRNASLGDGGCGERVGAERRVRAVLFGAADREHRKVALAVPYLGPCCRRKLHIGCGRSWLLNVLAFSRR